MSREPLRRGHDWRLLGRLLRAYRWRLLALGLVNFVGGLLEAGFLVVVTRVALAVASDEPSVGVARGRDVSIGAALGVAALLVSVRIIAATSAVWLSAGLRQGVTLELRRRMAAAYLRASWEAQQRERSGRLQQFLNQYVSSALGVVDAATMTLGAGLNLLAMLSTAVVIDPLAWVLVLLGLGVLGLVIAPLRRRVRVRSSATEQAGMRFSTSVADLSGLALEVQMFGVRDPVAARLDRLAVAEAAARRRFELLRGVITPVYTSLAYLALVGALWGVALIGVGELSALGAVMLIMLRSLSYGQNLQGALTSLSAAAPILTVYYDAVEEFEANPAPGGRQPIEQIGTLTVEQVSFEYQPGVAVLTDVSMSIPPGQIVGVIGPSGAGKSTLVQLLLGLRSPTAGVVRAGGVDLSDVSRESWASLVAYVPQAPQLFDGTVAENIALFRDLTAEAIEHAARRAHLHDEILAMPDGYDSLVGPRGGRLSGGQQQRLCIARALAGDPEVLILDEPTSSLDPRSEALICETLGELRGHSTVVVIAHRLSTLSVSDRIAVIQDGSLTAFDTAAELQAREGFYREALALSGIQ